MKTELEWEWLSARSAMTPAHRERLRTAGIGDTVPIGVSRVLVEGNRYMPFVGGRCAYVLPVRVDYPRTLESDRGIEAVRDGYLIDLLAFHPDRPRRWALRIGNATAIGSIPPQWLAQEPVLICRTPLAWLHNNCSGLVLLTDDPIENFDVLSQGRAVQGEDEAHNRELDRILARRWSGPKVVRHAA